MTSASHPSATQREPALRGQTVVVIGGSAGIGFETARFARAEGAEVIITARDRTRLDRAADELGARSHAAFDAADPDSLAAFFGDLPTPIDHVMVTAGRPYYARLADLDFERARREIDEHLWLMLHLARAVTGKVRPGGAVLFISGVQLIFIGVLGSGSIRRLSRLAPSPLAGEG